MNLIAEKQAGELAIRRMSQKARDFYATTSPLEVREYDHGNGTMYACRGVLNKDNMTFNKLEHLFEVFADEFKEV